MTVDIVVPFYGDPKMLTQAVRSVWNQDDPDWRLTVVDDGYPDKSVAAWFDEVDDERIRYRRNANNLGANANYRRCVELVENERAVIMGADDVMLPNYVGTVHRLNRECPGAGMIHPGVEVVDEDGSTYWSLADKVKKFLLARRCRHQRIQHGQDLAASLLRGNWTYFPSIAWRRDALRQHGFRGGLHVVQDLALVIDLLMAGETMLVDATPSFQYRRHRRSDSAVRAANGERFAEESAYFRAMSGELHAYGWERAARAARTHLSSRLHALAVLPKATMYEHSTARDLVSHTFESGNRAGRV